MALLRVVKDGLLLTETPLAAERISIGRGPENELRLADLTVSRVHARLLRQPDGRFMIADAGSTNGTSLNQQLLRDPAVLSEGDHVQIGVYTLLYSEAEAAEETARLSSKNLVHETGEWDAGVTAVGALVNEANNAVFAMAGGKATLGNDTDVDIRVPGKEKIRATISQRGEQFYVCSETPLPCVRLNGTLVMNATLSFNDRIEIGNRCFLFREL